MLMALILIFFGVIIIAGFMFMIGGVASGIGQVIGAKKRGEPLRHVTPPSVQKWAAKQGMKNRMYGYVPDVQVTIHQAPPANETPEQQAAREKAEERRRYLDSLVDR